METRPWHPYQGWFQGTFVLSVVRTVAKNEGEAEEKRKENEEKQQRNVPAAKSENQ